MSQDYYYYWRFCFFKKNTQRPPRSPFPGGGASPQLEGRGLGGSGPRGKLEEARGLDIFIAQAQWQKMGADDPFAGELLCHCVPLAMSLLPWTAPLPLGSWQLEIHPPFPQGLLVRVDPPPFMAKCGGGGRMLALEGSVCVPCCFTTPGWLAGF
ncbi:UNVERIFIED_CONTAM: hypothetical protein K2H54_031426 [Gekko kuhli]